MKKKPATSQHSKSSKKSIVNKNKIPKIKMGLHAQPECYVFLNDDIYAATTATERVTFEKFQTGARRKSLLVKSRKDETRAWGNRDIEDYLSYLNIDEKKKLMIRLGEELNIPREVADPMSQTSQQEDSRNSLSSRGEVDCSHHKRRSLSGQSESSEDKFLRLAHKLEDLKQEIESKWHHQLSVVEFLHDKGEISSIKKEEKISLLAKVKTSKINNLQCTRALFEKILCEDVSKEKEDKIQEIVFSLNSLPSLGYISERINKLSADSLPAFETPNLLNERQAMEFANPLSSSPQQDETNCEGQAKSGVNLRSYLSVEEQMPVWKQSNEAAYLPSEDLLKQLRLDLRLDEVQLGRDTYEEEKNYHQSQEEHIEQKTENQDAFKKKQDVNLLISTPQAKSLELEKVFAIQKKNSHEMTASIVPKLTIPMILTKQQRELERIQEYTARRISVQQGDIQIPDCKPFTTLIAVNGFLVGLYEYFMKIQLTEILDNLNKPYGQSVADKLYCLQITGRAEVADTSAVFSSEHLAEFHHYISQEREVSKEQIIHSKAVFDAFNASLNFYRPYFELDGDIYPWIVSQKAMTFYEINETNIEEVFEKSKVKVLQFCASLCGFIYDPMPEGATAIFMVEQRQKDLSDRRDKQDALQEYSDWKMKRANYETLIRLSIAELIINEQWSNCAIDIVRI